MVAVSCCGDYIMFSLNLTNLNMMYGIETGVRIPHELQQYTRLDDLQVSGNSGSVFKLN